MASVNRISPCLWFDDQAEQAANFYVGIFPNSKIKAIARYGKAGQEIHGQKEGAVMTVDFEIDGNPFTALNGGPIFKLNEAVSFQVFCKDQAEIDRYWEKLGEGGDPNAQQCGWLKDKFGLSWQIVPEGMADYFNGSATPGTERAMEAMLKMKKIDVAAMKKAYEGV